MEVETHKVASPDIVVPTLDTVRHEQLLYTWLADHKPMGKLVNCVNSNYNLFHFDAVNYNKTNSCLFTVLCGPPGSGKTMTLFSALRALPDMEVVGLNFSSATTPGYIYFLIFCLATYKRSVLRIRY